MSTESEQSALGYFQAWLEGKANGEITVRAFGAVGNERGGIHCVRVKVRDTILAIVPWAEILDMPPLPQQGVAADISEDMPVAEVTEPERVKYTYPGGAHRYACPSCEAKPGEACMTKSGNTATVPHSARENRMAT